jgi:2-C-methyl-D-erythritol 2,4-cyclodiphosphate synthase
MHYLIGNIDALILLEKPKLAAYMPQIKQSLCEVLGIEESQLNVKATRGEKLGFVGRSEGIMGQAVVLLVLKND